MNTHDFTVTAADGSEVALGDYAGKVLLIVNVASKCGLTPQYTGLEALQQEFADQGLVVLGFPCNQFAGQEPGTNEEIQEFCSLNYSVTFPVLAKIDVNGDDAAPLSAPEDGLVIGHTNNPLVQQGEAVVHLATMAAEGTEATLPEVDPEARPVAEP